MKQILIAAILLMGIVVQTVFAKDIVQNVNLQVTEKGFEPGSINVKPGTHVILKITRKTDATCATQIVINEKKIKKDLPLNQEVSVDVGTLEKGKVKFACGMDMVSGFINVE
ncbi:MAG: cupredoxin domain-containing protein [Bdellovibrio sp.]|nr:cupredoxin domain-containing protein [Bdellovibrio sp.]